MSETIFSKIINREIPATIVYETDKVLAFKDINPVAPVHILVIPKQEIESFNRLNNENCDCLIDIYKAIKEIVAEQGISETGYRLVINNGEDGLQSVKHLHVHIIGGKKLGWPPC